MIFVTLNGALSYYHRQHSGHHSYCHMMYSRHLPPTRPSTVLRPLTTQDFGSAHHMKSQPVVLFVSVVTTAIWLIVDANFLLNLSTDVLPFLHKYTIVSLVLVWCSHDAFPSRWKRAYRERDVEPQRTPFSTLFELTRAAFQLVPPPIVPLELLLCSTLFL